jgi:hypothetical protein
MDQQQLYTLPIPKEVSHPFFFTEKEIVIHKNIKAFHFAEIFTFEILFYNGIEDYMPWDDSVTPISYALEEWNGLKSKLEELHRNRDKKGLRQSMKTGIGLFLEILFWSNDRSVRLDKPDMIEALNYKPVNIRERLEFIMARPGLFHSYIQLSELMTEQEKLFAKKISLKMVKTINH